MTSIKQLETAADMLAAAQARGFRDLEDAAGRCQALIGLNPSPRAMRSYQDSSGKLSRWMIATWRLFFRLIDEILENEAL